jgi:RNA polymerase sigma-70 factor, ECF subfamily
MKRLPDERIVELLGSRAPEAIEALYDAYGGLMYTLVLRIVGDQQVAEDVLQECFLAVWRRADSFDAARGSLKSWMCAVARNRAIDRVRGQRGRVQLDAPLDVAVNEPGLSDTWSEVVAAITRQEIRDALDALPAEQRQTIELAYYGGYSQAEISRKMGIPLGTVKGRARLALERLRILMNGMATT